VLKFLRKSIHIDEKLSDSGKPLYQAYHRFYAR
jgi:hypothetical protein